jgi:hypothetical protein
METTVTENYNSLKITRNGEGVIIYGLTTGKQVRLTNDEAVRLSHGKTLTIEDETISYDHSRLNIFGKERPSSSIFGWLLEKAARENLGL